MLLTACVAFSCLLFGECSNKHVRGGRPLPPLQHSPFLRHTLTRTHLPRLLVVRAVAGLDHGRGDKLGAQASQVTTPPPCVIQGVQPSLHGHAHACAHECMCVCVFAFGGLPVLLPRPCPGPNPVLCATRGGGWCCGWCCVALSRLSKELFPGGGGLPASQTQQAQLLGPKVAQPEWHGLPAHPPPLPSFPAQRTVSTHVGLRNFWLIRKLSARGGGR